MRLLSPRTLPIVADRADASMYISLLILGARNPPLHINMSLRPCLQHPSHILLTWGRHPDITWATFRNRSLFPLPVCVLPQLPTSHLPQTLARLQHTRHIHIPLLNLPIPPAHHYLNQVERKKVPHGNDHLQRHLFTVPAPLRPHLTRDMKVNMSANGEAPQVDINYEHLHLLLCHRHSHLYRHHLHRFHHGPSLRHLILHLEPETEGQLHLIDVEIDQMPTILCDIWAFTFLIMIWTNLWWLPRLLMISRRALIQS